LSILCANMYISGAANMYILGGNMYILGTNILGANMYISGAICTF